MGSKKIVYVVTTKSGITLTRDEKGVVTYPSNSDRFKDLANQYYKRYLWLTTAKGAFLYGMFVEKYLTKVKENFPDLYNN